MTIFEKVKNFLEPGKEIEPESNVEPKRVLTDFEEPNIFNTGAFFDDEYRSVFGDRDKASILEAQKQKIMSYRNLAKLPDVHAGIEEIVNEIIFSQEKEILMIDIDEENDKVKDAITEAFDKVQQLLRFKKTGYQLVKQAYIDGQLVIHCSYNKNLSEGIERLKMVEPVYFYLDKKSNTYKYFTKDKSFYSQSNVEKGETYEPEEIIRETFGLHEDQINLSYLEYAIKSSNQLKTLEDLLIPMRFSRSVSRRVFNVDVGELQNTKAEQVMGDMQKKFKYKKFYNTTTGEITNQQHITSMVEDYWFANRSGNKGTQVDVLDETGNLGEINDILYFQKKLYKSMFIPQSRISENGDADKDFDYDSSSVSREDIKFFMFINRIRNVFIEMLNELLKREIVATNIMTKEDYEEYKDKIEIQFISENSFIEKMKIAQFSEKLDIYATVQEYNGKLFSVEHILKTVFKMDDEEIDEMFKAIEKEEKDPRFAKFYAGDDGY